MKQKIKRISIVTFIFLISNVVLAQNIYLSQIGKVDSIYSKTLKEQRKFWVQLPVNYKKENKYPVVYILDGEAHLPTASIVQNYYSGGFIPEMILIGISNEKHRTRDLTTSKIDTRQGGTFTQESGGAENFTLFLQKELIPYIEKIYPVTNYRTLIGHSFGGLFTVNTLIHHQKLFTNYLAIDPSLDWDNQKLVKEAAETLKKDSYKNKSLFISLSSPLHMKRNDITIQNIFKDTSDYTLFSRSNLEFTKLAKETKGLKTKWKFYPKDYHGTISFPSIMEGLKFFFDWYEIRDVYKFNNPNTPTSELVAIIKEQEKRYANHFGYYVVPFDEELLTMSGYMYAEMKQKEKSLAFFKLAVKYYPKSSNVYDSLAEYYANQKEYIKAIENSKKAYNLSKTKYHFKKLLEYREKIK